jgi:hypothetical protein
MFTQESENLAKVSHSIGCDIRLALFELDRVEGSVEEAQMATDRSRQVKEKIRDARNHVLNISFKLMEFSANPAGPKPEPSTKD